MPKPLLLTYHAQHRLGERLLQRNWIEATVREPEWVEPDPRDPELERRFRAIDEIGGRVLQVVVAETESHIRVISVLFDRDARRKP